MYNGNNHVGIIVTPQRNSEGVLTQVGRQSADSNHPDRSSIITVELWTSSGAWGGARGEARNTMIRESCDNTPVAA